MKQAVISLVESYAVIVDEAGNVDLPVQPAIALSVIELKAIRFHHLNHLSIRGYYSLFLPFAGIEPAQVSGLISPCLKAGVLRPAWIRKKTKYNQAT